jgi:signal transduction histidine kinase
MSLADNLYVLVLLGMLGTALLVTGFIGFQIHQHNKLLMGKKKIYELEIAYQKKLTYAVIQSQESERKRIGMDLHDEVGTALSTLRFMLRGMGNRVSASQLSGPVQVIDHIVQNVRVIAHKLSPRINNGQEFCDALCDLCDSVRETGIITMHLDLHEETLAPHINAELGLTLYRVISELINNTLKHADAQNIYLTHACLPEGPHFVYSDDGIGFCQQQTHSGVGLRNIESRLELCGAQWKIYKNQRGFRIEFQLSKPNT